MFLLPCSSSPLSSKPVVFLFFVHNSVLCWVQHVKPVGEEVDVLPWLRAQRLCFRCRREETLPRSFKLFLRGVRHQEFWRNAAKLLSSSELKCKKCRPSPHLCKLSAARPDEPFHTRSEAPCLLYLYPRWGVRRRGGKKSNRTGRMLLLSSRLVGASSQMWFVWQAGVRGSQKWAGRIFREAEMISFDCFLQHFLRLQPLLWFPSDKDSIWGSITRSRTSLCPDGHWFRSACTLTRRKFWEPPLPAWWHNLDEERLRLLLLIVDWKKQETHKVGRLRL